MKNLATLKKNFLRSVGANGRRFDEEQSVSNSINASLGRNPTYRPNTNNLRNSFRADWKEILREMAEKYRTGTVSEKQHVDNIKKVSDRLSKKHGAILQKGTLRIGTAQKSLNVYLKHLWCAGEIETPPHCPFDRKVLQEAMRRLKAMQDINAAKTCDTNWTELNCLGEYKEIIEALKKCAGDKSLSAWELEAWQNN